MNPGLRVEKTAQHFIEFVGLFDIGHMARIGDDGHAGAIDAVPVVRPGFASSVAIIR